MKLKLWTALSHFLNWLTALTFNLSRVLSDATFAAKARASYANLEQIINKQRGRA